MSSVVLLGLRRSSPPRRTVYEWSRGQQIDRSRGLRKSGLTLAGAGSYGRGTHTSSHQIPSAKPQAPTGGEREAEEYFHRAARQQKAKSLELRAGMSLVRLWQHQSKKTHAHQMLADTYAWFTEGFATADLQAAQALLQELS